MKQKIFSFYTVLILAVVALIVWVGFDFTQNSQAVSTRSQTPPVINKEALNNRKLNDLLERSNVRVDDAALLPARIEQTKMLHISLQTADAVDFAEQITEAGEVSLIKTKTDAGQLARQRFLELSPTLILVVAVNDRKQVLWWHTQPDPRVLRSDEVDAENRVAGKTLYRKTADMLVSLPADREISEVRFYHPVWDGNGSYSLSQIGSLSLNDLTEAGK